MRSRKSHTHCTLNARQLHTPIYVLFDERARHERNRREKTKSVFTRTQSFRVSCVSRIWRQSHGNTQCTFTHLWWLIKLLFCANERVHKLREKCNNQNVFDSWMEIVSLLRYLSKTISESMWPRRDYYNYLFVTNSPYSASIGNYLIYLFSISVCSSARLCVWEVSYVWLAALGNLSRKNTM